MTGSRLTGSWRALMRRITPARWRDQPDLYEQVATAAQTAAAAEANDQLPARLASDAPSVPAAQPR